MICIVIGASAAGLSGVRILRENNKSAEIILIAPDEIIHSRCILHRFINGEREQDKLSFVEDGFIKKNNVQWLKTRATGVDPRRKLVAAAGYGALSYDRLLIAAGSVAATPPIKNIGKAKNVFSLHDFEDAAAIKENAAKAGHIAVIGSGLVGCDVISGVLDMGAEISCYEFGAHILPVNLDKHSAGVYEKAFAEKGVTLHCGVRVDEILLDADNTAKSLKLSDGREFECDMLVVATGVKANTGFLEDSGLYIGEKGLVYDKYGKTSDDNIYAAGDISGVSPIWSAAVKEGIIAASNMSGAVCEMTDFFASKSTMNFLGIPTMSLGLPEKPDDSFTEVVDMDAKANYKKIIHRDGKIKGAILQGDLSYAGILTQLIREGIDVSKVKKPLFRIDYSDFFGEFV